MTTKELADLRTQNPNETLFGGITKIDRYPLIEIKYNLDGGEPLIFAHREITTIVQPDGQEPELSGQNPIGDSVLTQIAVTELHTWKAFEKELRKVLDDSYDDQHPGHGHGPPDHAGGPHEEPGAAAA